ncbi:MAG: hypothetical protein H6Q30_2816 [Bacteroidetes bacterium]|nr:hypothetical protein [Bacteroidota bacterium]
METGWLGSLAVVLLIPTCRTIIHLLLVSRTITRFFKTLNRHDVSKFTSISSSDGVFVYLGRIPPSGTNKG